ncbi:MAG: 16S rRNA (cytosine(1402)-N(4))-methyltransferase RsmH [Candidatus Xenobia bacterium]
MTGYHVPVMLQEVLQLMRVRSGGIYVDATLGGGGYAERLLEGLGPQGKVIGIDQDVEAIAHASKRLARFPNFVVVHANFGDLERVLDDIGIREITGIVFDLGVSSHMFDEASRGFSFRSGGVLDMRMDRSSSQQTAKDLVNRLPQAELQRILKDYGEEPFATRIARAIVERRRKQPLETTTELADVAWHCYPPKMRHGHTHPATRTFQALRIAVNDELETLKRALEAAYERLAIGGVMCFVSYHSGEDRIVKQFFQSHRARGQKPFELGSAPSRQLNILTPKPLQPRPEEIGHNPRSRSAKLRAAERI